MEISRRDAGRVVEIAAELRGIPDPRARQALALRRALEFLGAELAGFNLVHRPSGAAALSIVPDRIPDPSAALRSVLRDHPLIEHYMSRPGSAPTRLSDVDGGSDRSLRGSRMYSELLSLTGMRQIAIPIQVEAPAGGSAVTIHRSGTDFTPADVDRGHALQIALVATLSDDAAPVASPRPPSGPGEPVPGRPAGAARITDRQWAVLYLLCQGESVAAIADRYVISRHTVTTHRRDAYARLGLSGSREVGGWITAVLQRSPVTLEDRIARQLAT